MFTTAQEATIRRHVEAYVNDGTNAHDLSESLTGDVERGTLTPEMAREIKRRVSDPLGIESHVIKPYSLRSFS